MRALETLVALSHQGEEETMDDSAKIQDQPTLVRSTSLHMTPLPTTASFRPRRSLQFAVVSVVVLFGDLLGILARNGPSKCM